MRIARITRLETRLNSKSQRPLDAHWPLDRAVPQSALAQRDRLKARLCPHRGPDVQLCVKRGVGEWIGRAEALSASWLTTLS
jgi:hypothetical protein